jgi:23S rRNA (uracil1939-C5)-methyltransferase
VSRARSARGTARSASKAGRAQAPTGRAPRGSAELRIDSLAAGGAGVGRLPRETSTPDRGGDVVFVPRAAPGDRVEVAVEPGRPLRGRILRVIEAGPDRVVPPCPHVDACGGCDWMHLTAGAQEASHAAIVRAALAHASPLAEVPEVRVHAAPEALAYRTRARLFGRAERGHTRVGYRAAGSRALAPIKSCMVLDPAIAGMVQELPVILDGASGEGDLLIARGAAGRPVASILWRGDLAAATYRSIDERVSQGAWAGARVLLEGATCAASFGDPRACMAGADGAPLVIAEGAFAQTSSEGAAMLARRVAELARADRPQRVVELFAGSGTLSVALIRGAESLVAVEVSPEAAACARENLAARGAAGSWKVVVTDADAFPIPPRTDVVVLDPPRSGAPGAARAIAASRAFAVVYVACDPATLARDVAVLTAAGLQMTAVETFELFPQTSHVETVVKLERSRARLPPG